MTPATVIRTRHRWFFGPAAGSPAHGRCVSWSRHSGFHRFSDTLFCESDSESDGW